MQKKCINPEITKTCKLIATKPNSGAQIHMVILERSNNMIDETKY